ncbi:unnamed protein product [Trichobilharzia regenti]|nr:unnamed protein product [Trichobilharzia regenti]
MIDHVLPLLLLKVHCVVSNLIVNDLNVSWVLVQIYSREISRNTTVIFP